MDLIKSRLKKNTKLFCIVSLLFCLVIYGNTSIWASTIKSPLSIKIIDSLDSTLSCETKVLHYEYAKDSIDAFDAQFKPSQDNLNIFSQMYGSTFVINSTGTFNHDMTIKLGIWLYANKTTGSYYLWASDISGYTGSSMVLLVDSATNPPTITSLKATPKLPYSFPPNSSVVDRFYIKLSPTAYTIIDTCGAENKLIIRNPSQNKVKYSLKRLSDSKVIAQGDSLVGDTILYNLLVSKYTITYINVQSETSIDTLEIPNPITIAILPNDTTINLNSAIIDFKVELNKNITKLKYAWDFGDSTSVDSLDIPTHSYKKIGIYKVKLTVLFENGCQLFDSILINVSNTVGLQSRNTAVKIYYNSKRLIVDNLKNYNHTLTIVNMLGETLSEYELFANRNEQKFDLNELSPGVYLVNIFTNNETISKKIVIEP